MEGEATPEKRFNVGVCGGLFGSSRVWVYSGGFRGVLGFSGVSWDLFGFVGVSWRLQGFGAWGSLGFGAWVKNFLTEFLTLSTISPKTVSPGP